MKNSTKFIDSFAFCFVIDTLVAIIGTAVLSADFVFHPHSVTAIVWKESILSIAIGGAIGYFLKYRRQQDNAALWVWVLPTIWLLFGAMTKHNLLLGMAPTQREVVSFFAFTIPAVRTAAFSLGALLAQRRTLTPRSSVS